MLEHTLFKSTKVTAFHPQTMLQLVGYGEVEVTDNGLRFYGGQKINISQWLTFVPDSFKIAAFNAASKAIEKVAPMVCDLNTLEIFVDETLKEIEKLK